VEMFLNPVQLGPGEYVISASIHKADHLSLFNGTLRYDLLDRSFEFSIEIQDSLAPIAADFFHSSEWEFRSGQ